MKQAVAAAAVAAAAVICLLQLWPAPGVSDSVPGTGTGTGMARGRLVPAFPAGANVPCVTSGRRGAFASTCFDVHLHDDAHTLQATCAADGSMTHFHIDTSFDLDAHIGSFEGHLEVVLYCTPTADGPLTFVPCAFSRSCAGVEIVVDDPAQFEPDGTEIKSRPATAWLFATCPDSNGTLVHNRLNLNPYITNHRGRLEWTCKT